MKNLYTFLLSVYVMIFASCQTSEDIMGGYNILPKPDIAEFSGPSNLYPDEIAYYRLADGIKLPVPEVYLKGMEETNKATGPQIVFRDDKSILPVEEGFGTNFEPDPEGYVLDISRNTISINADKKVGRFYGFMTLLQLMEDARERGEPLPMCHIEDTPALSYRAIHLDMKHHMEKTEYYYELIDKLALYKVNAIIAEVEDKLAYERQPLVGSADALSMEEWKNLSDYADDRYIEISPLVQGLGHASYILKHDKYKFLRDDPDSDWAFNPLLPETYEVQFDLYLDALEAMPHGKYLHVGGDEVHTTGRGSGLSELELQLTWLNKVCQFAEEHDRIPIFWDDMPLKYAGLYNPMFNTSYSRNEINRMWRENEYKLADNLDMFPENCIYMRWNYSHPEAEGNIKAMEWFIEHELSVMGATAGQTRWKLMPQNESNMENIRSFASTSIEKGIDGLLLTLWDDDSPHFELYMRGILAFAEYTWSGDVRSKEELKASYRHREYGSALSGEEFGFVDDLEKAVEWWNAALLKSNSRNNLRNMEDPLEAVIDLPFLWENEDEWMAVHSIKLQNAALSMRYCNRALAAIDTMKTLAIRNQYRLEVYEQVTNLVRFSGQAMIDLQAYAMAADGLEREEALARLKLYPESFQELRARFEEVYGRTRILHKPEDYKLDQDHHLHMANQSINFDWQFWSEIYFLEKLTEEISNLK